MIKLVKQSYVHRSQDPQEMKKEGFPYPKFKLVHQDNKHVKKIKSYELEKGFWDKNKSSL
jgi:hypothetical protein